SASSGQLDRNLNASLLLAYEANRASQTPEARSSMIVSLEAVRRSRATAILRGRRGPVYGVVFSPDGHTLASVSGRGTVRLWDVRGQTPLGPPLRGHGGLVQGVAFSPDGRTLASGSNDGTVRLWNVPSQKSLGPPLRAHGGPVLGVAFSPDGRTLA